jgi:hypothetical protein
MRPTACPPLLAILLLTAHPASAEDPTRGSTCVDVMVGSVQSYACLNQQLRRLTENIHGSNAEPDIRADSPAPATGTFNQAAEHERLGTAFGHSLIPQRPATLPPVPPFGMR